MEVVFPELIFRRNACFRGMGFSSRQKSGNEEGQIRGNDSDADAYQHVIQKMLGEIDTGIPDSKGQYRQEYRDEFPGYQVGQEQGHGKSLRGMPRWKTVVVVNPYPFNQMNGKISSQVADRSQFIRQDDLFEYMRENSRYNNAAKQGDQVGAFKKDTIKTRNDPHQTTAQFREITKNEVGRGVVVPVDPLKGAEFAADQQEYPGNNGKNACGNPGSMEMNI